METPWKKWCFELFMLIGRRRRGRKLEAGRQANRKASKQAGKQIGTHASRQASKQQVCL